MKWLIQKSLRSKLILCLYQVVLFSRLSSAQTMSGGDEQAMKELEGFLNSPSERASFGATRPDAQKANNFLEALPAWVQKEIIDINLMIVRERGEGAKVHVDALKSGGVDGAMSSFSPAVKSRIDMMVKRLEADPAFNNQKNLGDLKSKMPMLLGFPSS